MEYATVEKVAEGFKAVKNKQEHLQAAIDENAACFEQLKKNLSILSSHIVNQFRDGGNQPYNGKTVWPNEEQARTFGMLVVAAAGKAQCIRDDHGVLLRALSEGSSVGGGYSVPTEMLGRVIDLLGVYGKFQANCSVIPMGSDKLIIPQLVTDCTIFCPGESAEIDESDLEFGQVKLLAKTFAGLLAISNELNEDSLVAIGEIVGRSLIRSFAAKIDAIGFCGDGTEAFFGMTGAIGIFEKMLADSIVPAGLAIGSGDTWPELTWADFEAMFALLPEQFESEAKLFCSKTFFYNVIRRAALAAGTNATGMTDLLSPNKTKYVNGAEVVFVPSMPSVAVAGKVQCLLGDLQMAAYLGVRKQLTIDSSEHVLFKKYQTCVRGITRCDVNVFGCGDSVSPGPLVGLRLASQ